MSFSATLFQSPLMGMPFMPLMTSIVQLTLLGGLLMFFRPLLIGIARALVLVVRPRPSKPRTAKMLQAAADGALGSHT